MVSFNKSIIGAIAVAVDIASISNAYRKHGAVAVYKNKITGIDKNSYEKSSALQRLYAKKVGRSAAKYNHAEVAAVNKCNGKLDTLIVVRVNDKGELLNSKPCSICMELLHDFGVKRVYYSCNGEILQLKP